MELPRNEQ